MAQGPIDHPSYLTRQRFSLGLNAAGSGALGNHEALPFAIRPHVPYAAVQTAGTSTANNVVALICVGTYTLTSSGTSTTTSGTNTIGSIAVGTATANSVVFGTDMNITVNAGGIVYSKQGTDVVGVSVTGFDYTLDPVLGTWTGV